MNKTPNPQQINTRADRPRNINKKLASKVLKIVDAGLVKGLGIAKPGKMCVEAAVNYALGAKHGDEPACVGKAVRAFKIRLNDCDWPSDKARTDGMRELAVAQLGSDQIDQMEFGKLMFLRGTQKLMPFVFRHTAAQVSEDKKVGYLNHADACEKVATFDDAKKASKSADAYADAYASADAYADAYAYAYTYAYADAYASADAYVSANAYANASAYADADFKHELLKRTAQVGLECLIELKSPGCKYLDLCK